MDFTYKRYIKLIKALKSAGYAFLTFEEYTKLNPQHKTVVIRHDVDRSPKKALKLAAIENHENVSASYYFRARRRVFRPQVLREIVKLGHELGYHYEDLADARGNCESAIHSFQRNLERFRRYYPVTTICMHGSPLSRFDNRVIWEEYDYKEFGIIAEPYLDVDYSRVLYITDTGRKWNDEAVNLRDKIEGLKIGPVKSSISFVKMIENKAMQDIVIINIHPNRWHGDIFSWAIDFIFQLMKNPVKAMIIKFRKNV